MGIILILFITNTLLTYASIELKKIYGERKEKECAKSLFGISLMKNKKERNHIYFIESLIIGGNAILLNIIFHLFHLQFLYITKMFFENKSVNEFLILGVSYLLLVSVSFIIELGFGETILKRYEK